MRIVVAGGAGFIGSHLCDRLLKMGHQVVALDDLSSGRRPNLRSASASLRFEFIRHDVRDPWPQGLKADWIFNLASAASPRDYQARPIDTLMSNALGGFQLLEAARKRSAGYLLASTSEVYGEPLRHPQRETDWGQVNPVGLRACYDEAKRFAEALTMEYVRQHRVNARIVRIFNTYGPRMRPQDGRVISNFMTQALAGGPLTLFGQGQQTRSFCFVDDLVEGLVRAAFKPRTRGQVINLGNPHEVTVREIAERIVRLSRRPLALVHRPLPPDDPTRRRPDIRRAKRLLAWRPGVSLNTGLQRTLAWFQDSLGRKGPRS